MALEGIKILGFRGFQQEGTLEFAIPNSQPGSGLTVITGPNNSGKTTIIESIRARSIGGVSFSEGKRNKSTDSVSITFNLGGRSETIQSIRRGSSEVSRDTKTFDPSIFVLPSRRAFEPYFSKSDMTRSDYQSNFGNMTQRRSNLDGFYVRLFGIIKNPEKFNEIIGKILGYVPDWSIDQTDQGNHYLKFFNHESTHSSDGMGEGIVSIFAIIDSLYDSSPGDVIVIDEPELSIHPALQKRLARVLVDFAADRQIIIATHSPHFIDFGALQSGGKIARVVSSREGTKIFQLSNESIAAIGKLTNGNLYNPHVFGLEAKELFFQDDGIILTEGQEDVLLYPLVADQIGADVSGNFFGWGAGGANNIRHLCVILRDLGFKRVAAVLDGDKIAEMQELRVEFPDFYFNVIPAADIRTKKARSASQPVAGILNENREIRPEYVEAMKVVFSELNAHIAPIKLTTSATPLGLEAADAIGFPGDSFP